ncbi:MAG: hypothetical protein AB7K09_23735 [Planctomycetota bacterium]
MNNTSTTSTNGNGTGAACACNGAGANGPGDASGASRPNGGIIMAPPTSANGNRSMPSAWNRATGPAAATDRTLAGRIGLAVTRSGTAEARVLPPIRVRNNFLS